MTQDTVSFGDLDTDRLRSMLNGEFNKVAQSCGDYTVDAASIKTRKYRLLRTSLRSDKPEVIKSWYHALKDSPQKSREGVTLDLFNSIGPEWYENLSENNVLHGMYEFDVNRISRWLLSRYDLPRARRALAGTTTHARHSLWAIADWTNVLLALWVVAVAVLYAVVRVPASAVLFLVAIGYLAAVLAPRSLMNKQSRRAQLAVSIKLLLPRMAAAVAVGWLFLVADPSLRDNMIKQPPVVVVGLGLLVVAAYLWLEMNERIVPAIRWNDAASRVMQVFATGLAHSLSVVLMWLPYFDRVDDDLTVGLAGIFVLAGTLLAIGMLINVVWAEEPVTAPL